MKSSGPAYDDCVRAHGTILRTISAGLFEVALPNGKPVIGHLSKALAASPPELPANSVVLLEISPFDLDRCRIAQVVNSATGD